MAIAAFCGISHEGERAAWLCDFSPTPLVQSLILRTRQDTRNRHGLGVSLRTPKRSLEMGHDRLGVFVQHDGDHIEPAGRLLHALLPQPGLRRLCDAALLCFRYGFFRTPEPETGTGFYFHEHNLPTHAPHIGRIGRIRRDRRCPAYHIEFKPPEPVISLENAVSDRFQIRRGNVFASAAYVLSMSGHTDALLRGLSSRRTAPDAVRSNRKPSLPGTPPTNAPWRKPCFLRTLKCSD